MVDAADVLEGDLRLAKEATMDDKGPLADDRRDGQSVEEPLEELDEVLVVRVLAAYLPREAAAGREGALVEITLLVVAAVEVDRARLGQLRRGRGRPGGGVRRELTAARGARERLGEGRDCT